MEEVHALQTQGSEPGRDEGSAVSIGQVLVALQEVKDDLRQVSRQNEELHQELIGKLADFKSGVLERLSKYSLESRSTASRSRSSVDKSRKRPPIVPENVAYLKELSDADRGVIPHLKWVMLLTVLIFSNAQPNSKLWMSDEALEKTSEAAAAVDGVSGLSLMFFASLEGRPDYATVGALREGGRTR